MAKVTLDMETFKALASSTRLQLLRALDERRKTLSELSKELDLNKATVHEHLQLLTATGLIKKRDDEGRKWIYYELTWQGERLLHPQETTTFAVLLGFSVLAAGGGVTMLGRALDWWWAEKQMEGTPEGDSDAMPESSNFGAAQADQNDTASPSASPSAPPPEQRDLAGDDAGDTELAADSGGGFFDEGGWISLALLVTSVLLAALAWTVRRSVKGRSE